jgi:hypothetical protein
MGVLKRATVGEDKQLSIGMTKPVGKTNATMSIDD